MKFPTPGRVLFLVVVAGVFLTGAVFAYFQSWRLDVMNELNGASETTLTSAGNLEFLAKGDGPAVLVFHGAPGGHDQAMLVGSGLLDEQYQIIAPSRPGYLRTPLAVGKTPAQQADAMAALLDDMGVSSVAVMAFSGGTPAALEFAAKYPERVWAMVIVSGTYAGGGDASAALGRSGFYDSSDIGSWVRVEVAEKDPERELARISEMENAISPEKRVGWGHFVRENPDQLEWFQALMGTFAPTDARAEGYKNDVDQLAAWKAVPLDRIKAPVLIVHGTADKIFPFGAAQNAASVIPNCKFLPVEDAGHLVQLGPGGVELRKQVSDFLAQFHGGQPQP